MTKIRHEVNVEDIQSYSAWAEVIIDLMYIVPQEARAMAISIASSRMEERRKKIEANNGLFKLSDYPDDGYLTYHAEMRLKSLVVQVFTRDITNNNSPEDARDILFAHHRNGTGSGDLLDYIDDVLKSQKDKERRQQKKGPPAEAGGDA